MIGPLCYVGGKRRIAAKLAALIPPHTTYVEPFAGGAQVFFAKDPSRVEVLNDLDGDIVNFFRVCQAHHDELIRYLRFTLASRRVFDLYDRQDPTTLTDVQRAARFLYLQKNAFGGRVVRRNYHFCVASPPNYNPGRLAAVIAATAKRLERVQIECLPYSEVLSRFDRPTTFFYLDPPYVGAKLYAFNLEPDDFRRLAIQLTTIRSRFLLSINDHPLAREAFAGFTVREIRVVYTVTRKVPAVRELLVANYDLPAVAKRSRGLLDSEAMYAGG